MRRFILASLAAFSIAGCGSSTHSAAAYRAKLDAACTAGAAADAQVPKLEFQRHFTATEVAAFLRRHGSQFNATLHALKPPGSLSSANAALLKEFAAQPPGTELSTAHLGPAIAHERTLEQIYARLGASTCEANTRTNITALEKAAASAR